MNFDLSSEQQLLKDSVERFVADNYSLEARVKVTDAEPGFSKDHWKSFADLGWLALPFAEADGGFGGGPIETMLLMEAFGKGLVVEPYLASVVLGGGALRRGASKAVKDAILPGVIDGTQTARVRLCRRTGALRPRRRRHDARAQTANGFVLNGTKSVVQNAATADHIVVSARTSGGQVDRNGISLFLVDAKADGVERDNYPTVDGLRASEVKLTNVRVDRDRADRRSRQGLRNSRSGRQRRHSGAVGRSRRRDGSPVQRHRRIHRAAPAVRSRAVGVPGAAAPHGRDVHGIRAVQIAAVSRDARSERRALPSAQRTIHALKHLVGKAGIFIGENAVQLHGGMGMTEELRIGHYFKRLLVIDAQFGNADHHLQKFAA